MLQLEIAAQVSIGDYQNVKPFFEIMAHNKAFPTHLGTFFLCVTISYILKH